MAVRALLRRELMPWTLLGLALGLVEGATAAVLIKARFTGVSPDWAVNLAVALVSGAPALSNVLSFVWANLAHGRRRLPLLVSLQVAFALTVAAVGLAPQAQGGLLMTTLSVLVARMLWSGLLTVRSSVWMANYPRHWLARATGQVVVASSLAIAAMAAVTALTLERGHFDPRWLYAFAALCGLAAAWLYGHTRVRREFKLIAAETGEVGRSDAFSLRMLVEILRADADYRRYMFHMGLFGAGGLMLTSQLIVVLSDHSDIPPSVQILMLAVVPLVVLPLCVPLWARMFDGQHTVTYRSRQAWALVAAAVVTIGGALGASQPLLWLGAVMLGCAYAGANLGWNLGHGDFATPGRAQHYMGVHVTLTGVRGMLAPPAGMLVYEALEHAGPGLGRWSLLLPLALLLAGASGFNAMRREHARRSMVTAGDG